LRGSISAEQSPTIAFTPVSGDRVLRRLAAETPLDLAVLVVNAANSHKLAWMAMIRTVNDIRNVDFIDPPMLVTDPRFEEIASLIDVLERRGMLRWVELSGGQTGIGMLLHNYAPSGMSEVARLLDLLGLQKIAHEGRDVAIPMRASFGSTQEGTISVETWTLFDLMRWGAASIDLPPGETTAGAIHYPERSALVSKLHILSSSSRPSGSRVTAEYRGRFYYIDQQDELSKQWFSLVGLLASAQVPDTGLSPVLTVPVGKR
jgi:hypothetical protein